MGGGIKAPRSFVILRRSEAETGGPSGARERETAARIAASDILPEQIAFGAAGSPGLRRKSGLPEDDEGMGSGIAYENTGARF